jgi:hypothetical protein
MHTPRSIRNRTALKKKTTSKLSKPVVPGNSENETTNRPRPEDLNLDATHDKEPDQDMEPGSYTALHPQRASNPQGGGMPLTTSKMAMQNTPAPKNKTQKKKHMDKNFVKYGRKGPGVQGYRLKLRNVCQINQPKQSNWSYHD